MTVQLRSLRVSADMDASGYQRGAQQKVQADKDMTASAREASAAVQEIETRVGRSGDVLSRLSRQYVDGYAAAQRMNTAVNQLARGIDTGRISMAQAEPILDGIIRKYGQIDTAAELAARGQTELATAIAAANARMTAQTAAATSAASSVARMHGAANQNVGGFLPNTANIAAQFQDIGVTAAAGMSPLQIALQQGTQLSAVFEDIRTRGQGVGTALATAFASLISPVSLVTLGVVGLSAAAIQFFGSWMSGSGDAEKALREQEQLINRVASRWGDALPALKAYNDELGRSKEIAEAMKAAGLLGDQQYGAFTGGDAGFMARIGGLFTGGAGESELSRLRGEYADLMQLLQTAGVAVEQMRPLRTEFDQLAEALRKNTAVGQDAFDVQRVLLGLLTETGIPAIGDYADEFGRLAPRIQEAAEQAAILRREAELLEQRGGIPLSPYGGGRGADPRSFVTDPYYRGRYFPNPATPGRPEPAYGIPTPTPRPNDIERMDWQRPTPAFGAPVGWGRPEWQDQLRTDLSGFASDFRQALLSNGGDIGDAFAKSFGNALMNSANRLFDKAMNMVLDAIMGTGFQDGRGGGLPALIGYGSSALGVAANDNTPNFSAPVGAVTRMPLGSPSIYRDAIANIESRGSGGYSALGPLTGGDRAYGRYQVMGNNVGPWSEAALGRRLSPSQFLADSSAQDAVFDHRFGGYVDKYGPTGAAQAWFGGPGSVGKLGRSDVLGTSVGGYAEKFESEVSRLSQAAGGATDALSGFGGGLGKLGQALSSIGGGAGGGWFSGLISKFGSIGGATSFMNGISPLATAAIAKGAIGLFAEGGVSDRPAIFGEAGPEAAVPLSRGRYIPVELKGGANQQPAFSPTFNIDARGSSMSRAEFEEIAREQSQQALALYNTNQRRGGFGETQRRFASQKG